MIDLSFYRDMRARAEAVLNEVDDMRPDAEYEDLGHALFMENPELRSIMRVKHDGDHCTQPGPPLLGSIIGSALGMGRALPASVREDVLLKTQQLGRPVEARVARLEARVEALEQRLKKQRPPTHE